MTPRALLDAGADALHEVLKDAQPADAVLADRFRRDRSLGARDRHALSEMVHAVLRRRRWFEQLARTAPPTLTAAARKGVPTTAFALAVLGWPDDAAFMARALDEPVRRWRDDALALVPAPGADDELRLHLPAWITDDLRLQLDAAELDALATALNQPAPLDLRVNTHRAKREAVQAALAAEGIVSTPTRWSPWGLRVQGKPSLTAAGPLTRGEIEVQDEGSQLLALLLGALRNEVHFLALLVLLQIPCGKVLAVVFCEDIRVETGFVRQPQLFNPIVNSVQIGNTL
jgi:16S rRNA (cytosine967-C5)-methyltransferase